MFDTHERILQKLDESGQKEFSAEMIKGIIAGVENEEVDKMYAQWLRDTEPGMNHEAAYLTSWEEATEDLGDIPQRQPSRETELER